MIQEDFILLLRLIARRLIQAAPTIAGVIEFQRDMLHGIVQVGRLHLPSRGIALMISAACRRARRCSGAHPFDSIVSLHMSGFKQQFMVIHRPSPEVL